MPGSGGAWAGAPPCLHEYWHRVLEGDVGAGLLLTDARAVYVQECSVLCIALLTVPAFDAAR